MFALFEALLEHLVLNVCPCVFLCGNTLLRSCKNSDKTRAERPNSKNRICKSVKFTSDSVRKVWRVLAVPLESTHGRRRKECLSILDYTPCSWLMSVCPSVSVYDPQAIYVLVTSISYLNLTCSVWLCVPGMCPVRSLIKMVLSGSGRVVFLKERLRRCGNGRLIRDVVVCLVRPIIVVHVNCWSHCLWSGLCDLR